MKSITVFLALMLIIAFAHHVYAEDNSCRIMAGPQDNVWVIIYDADTYGNPGPIIWKGKIEAGKSIPITSTDGNIRIDYTMDPSQAYDGGPPKWMFWITNYTGRLLKD